LIAIRPQTVIEWQSMKIAQRLLAALLAAMPLSILAHGDLHIQIQEVTRQIEKEPRNPDLYLKRGELHRAHQEWDAAQADYDHAFALNPKLTVVNLARGRMFLEANWPISAKVALDRFLAVYTNHVEGLVARARTLVKLDQRLAAARDYTAAINHSAEPRPELYLERAQALTSEGGGHLDEALQGLDEGIKKLGPLVTLQLYAIDVEIKQKRFDGALSRLDRIAAQSPRKETWLARRGEILQQAGRKEEAREAFQAALAAMDKLPPARRNVPAMAELEKRLQQALDALNSGEPNTAK
jgi:predicted Zn-dependent protease